MEFNWKSYEKTTLREILEIISINDDPTIEKDCKEAFYVLIERFREDLLNKCEVICKKREFDLGFAVELANDTFKRYYKYPRFNIDNYTDDKILETKFKRYLYRIANNLIIDYYNNKTGKNQSIYSGDEEIIREFPDIESLPKEKRHQLRKKLELIDKALLRLSPKHKIIYLTYQQYEERGYKLPRKLLNELREELSLSQSTIRYYKSEAYKIVETVIEVYGK